jgi:hypothetical protein
MFLSNFQILLLKMLGSRQKVPLATMPWQNNEIGRLENYSDKHPRFRF